MLPPQSRDVFIEDLAVSPEDLENFRARRGKWAPVQNFFGIEEKPPRYNPNKPVQQCSPELAFAYAYQPFEIEEEDGDEIEYL